MGYQRESLEMYIALYANNKAVTKIYIHGPFWECSCSNGSMDSFILKNK